MSLSVLSMAVLILYSDFGVNKRFRLVAGLVSLILFVSFCLPIYLTYTPVGYKNIVGLQGRYYLPAIPFIFIAIAFNSSEFNWAQFFARLRRNSEWIVTISMLGLIVAYTNIP